MVDVHCHLLPNVDDGAKSWEMTQEMCRVAENDGISHIVCTPHANEEFKYDRAQHEKIIGRLRESSGTKLTFSLGCDFNFSYDNIQSAIESPDDFLIARSEYLLVELSDFAMSPAITKALERLVSMGIRPIITHPERNLMLQRHADHVIAFAKKGCAVQVTANALTGHWGEGPRKMAHWLLEHGVVHVIATDAHDPKFRPPVLSKARDIVTKSYGEETALALVENNPRAIVTGKPLPWWPEPRNA